MCVNEEVQEIPGSQRLLNRPGLEEVFNEGSLKEKQKRNRKIKEAVESYGYSQKEAAHYLKMHYLLSAG